MNMLIFWVTLSAASFGFAVGFITCALFGQMRERRDHDWLTDPHEDGLDDIPAFLKRQAE